MRKIKITLIHWSVYGGSSFNVRLPLRTIITLHPERFNHTHCRHIIYLVMVCSLSFLIVGFQCSGYLFVMQVLMSLFILELPSTTLKASCVYFVWDMAALQTSNLCGSCFFWAKPLNHNLSVPPLSLQGNNKCFGLYENYIFLFSITSCSFYQLKLPSLCWSK